MTKGTILTVELILYF